MTKLANHKSLTSERARVPSLFPYINIGEGKRHSTQAHTEALAHALV